MLYSSINEPDDSLTTYQTHVEAVPQFEETQEWLLVLVEEDSEMEPIFSGYIEV